MVTGVATKAVQPRAPMCLEALDLWEKAKRTLIALCAENNVAFVNPIETARALDGCGESTETALEALHREIVEHLHPSIVQLAAACPSCGFEMTEIDGVRRYCLVGSVESVVCRGCGAQWATGDFLRWFG
jgi:hypothetical protein